MALFNTFPTTLFIVFPVNRKVTLEIKNVGRNHKMALS